MVVIARKTLIALLCCWFVVSLGYVISLDLYYWKTLPWAPDHLSKRTERIVVSHGSIRYGTGAERNALLLAEEIAAFACLGGLLAGIMNTIYKDF